MSYPEVTYGVFADEASAREFAAVLTRLRGKEFQVRNVRDAATWKVVDAEAERIVEAELQSAIKRMPSAAIKIHAQEKEERLGPIRESLDRVRADLEAEAKRSRKYHIRRALPEPWRENWDDSDTL